MIRVNLLRNRKEGLGGLVSEPAAASSFISGREVLLAGLFLVLGGAILWFVLGHHGEPDPAVTAGGAVTGDESAEAVVTPARGDAGRPAPTRLAAPPATGPAATQTTAPAVTRSTPATAVAAPTSATPAPAAGATASSAAQAGSRGSTLLAERSSAAQAPAAPSSAPAAQPAATGGVITMRGLSVLGTGNSLQILASTTGQPEYKMFRVENPNRVVIDLAGVRHEIPREYREQRLSNSIVSEVRVAQNQLDPPIVRMVLQVESYPQLQILARPDGLLINVTGP